MEPASGIQQAQKKFKTQNKTRDAHENYLLSAWKTLLYWLQFNKMI